MCDAVTASVVMGVMSAGLQIMQQAAITEAKNATINFENMAAQQQHDQQLLQTTANRNAESQTKALQDDLIAQTVSLANLDFENQISQINLGLQHEQALAGQKKREAQKEFLEGRGEVLASGRAGNTVANLLADYRRQKAAFDYATDQNLAFVGQQGQQEKRGANIQRAARIASQQPYLERMFLDPLEPMKRPNVKGPGFVGILSAGLSGAQTGFSVYPGMKEIYKKT